MCRRYRRPINWCFLDLSSDGWFLWFRIIFACKAASWINGTQGIISQRNQTFIQMHSTYIKFVQGKNTTWTWKVYASYLLSSGLTNKSEAKQTHAQKRGTDCKDCENRSHKITQLQKTSFIITRYLSDMYAECRLQK